MIINILIASVGFILIGIAPTEQLMFYAAFTTFIAVAVHSLYALWCGTQSDVIIAYDPRTQSTGDIT